MSGVGMIRGIRWPVLLAGLALLGLAGCSGDGKPGATENGAGGGPPAAGPYAAATFGEHATDPGERLFGQECAFCHVGPRNTGTMMLERRLGKGKGELTARTDLDPAYVKVVVRNGLVNMPPFSKVELTDADLDAIAAWLARNNPK